MARFILRNCSVGVSLRTGSFIVGYIQLFLNFLIMIVVVELMAAEQLYVTNVLDGTADASASPNVMTLVNTYLAVLLMLAFVGFNVVLLVGLHQSRRGLINAYVALATIYLVFYFIVAVSTAFSGASMHSNIVICVYVALYVYFLLVIRSYYYQLKQSEEKRPAPADELAAVA